MAVDIMHKRTQHNFIGIMISVLLGVFASCSRNTDSMDVPAGEITLGVSFRTTNSPSGNGYEAGDIYENYIDVEGGNYRIYFFDSDNKFIARFEPSEFVVTEGSNYRNYNILGKVPDVVAGLGRFKIVMLANWQHYNDEAMKAGETDLEEVCSAEWAQYDGMTDFELNPAENRMIPFYGVHEYTDVEFKSGMATILQEPLTLLRAVAKVEVILDTSDESGDFLTDVSFSNVSVCRYNAKGYCAPSGVYSQSDYGQGNDWDTDYLPLLHLVGGKNDSENATNPDERRLEFLWVGKRSDSENEKWIAYLPEYYNGGEDYSYIEATLYSRYGEPASYKIYFSQYVDGERDETRPFFDIARNNLYRFTVRVRNGKLQVNVLTWENAYDNDYTFE